MAAIAYRTNKRYRQNAMGYRGSVVVGLTVGILAFAMSPKITASKLTAAIDARRTNV
jgi:hypothetical protein